MKKIKLFADELKYFFKKKTLLSILLIIGLSLSFFSLDLMRGCILYSIRSYYSGNLYNTYTVLLDKEDECNLIDKFKELSNWGLKNALMMTVDEKKPMIIGWYGEENNNRWFLQNQGTFFNIDEVNNKSKAAIISDSLYPNPDVDFENYNIIFDNQSYKIIGLADSSTNKIFFIGAEELYENYYIETNNENYDNICQPDDDHKHEHDYNNKSPNDYKINSKYIIIPYSTYCEFNYRPDIIRLEFTVTSTDLRTKIKDQISQLFLDKTILMPPEKDYSYSLDMWISLLKSIGVCVASMINMIGVFLYLQSMRIPVYKIYIILGSTKKTIIMLNFLSWFVILGASFIVSKMILITTKPITNYLNIICEISVVKSALTFVFSLLFTFILSLPYLIKPWRLNK